MSFVVVLESDLDDEQAARVRAALAQMRGVLAVKPMLYDATRIAVENRVRSEIHQRLWDALYR